MKRTLDFNKMKKAHNAKKKWEELQKEQAKEKSNQNPKEPSPSLRKTS